MAGTAEKLSLDLDGLAGWANGEAKRLESQDFQKPLKQIKVLLSAKTKENFERAKAPDGSSWAPLKRARRLKGKWGAQVKARRKKTGETDQILRDKGILMASVTAANQAQGAIREITSNVLVYGTNIEYAGYHQHGTKHITARPFLGFNDEIGSTVDEIFLDFLSNG